MKVGDASKGELMTALLLDSDSLSAQCTLGFKNCKGRVARER